ncbi:La-related protein 6 [Manis javanica]|nr:La-related protein 6 [Manis javanica]
MAQPGEEALPGPETAVQIRVAIQEAEDVQQPEDQEEGAEAQGAGDPARYLSPGWGSASEEEPSRGPSGLTTSENEHEDAEQEDAEQDWKPPDEELIRKLVDQIEFYFSDENLERDAFLLKHVRRNKLGYVSVKLLTSFKKVKHLTRDWRTTAHALKYSGILELNEDHRKTGEETLWHI